MTRLCYCTNVHPAEDLDGILRQLDTYAVPVREKLGADRLGLGLWLAADVAAGLAASGTARRRLRAELDARGLAVITMNAFPYGGFHADVVKLSVYEPRWTDPRRLRYTVDCVTVLGDLLPDDVAYGGISTLPLGWREPWTAEDDSAALASLASLTRTLRSSPRRIKLAVEPEPGCVLDTVADTVAWLAPRVDPEYIGLCLDTCHLAVSFADPVRTVESITAAGLEIVKVQASAALHVDDPRAARAELAEFAEPRYLHQVRELAPDGTVLKADDLPEALETLPGEGPWRVHFHVPLHASPDAPLRSTNDVLTQVLTTVPGDRTIEVETYTWQVLPDRHRQDLVDGIAAELAWADGQLTVEVP
ncbi:metabolite traffic protein EboE [Kibdelosporangium persicum]|uniref:Xylose isomerase domain-containing protein TIM barrel n=1 Tax=Kibdelosporangium persicum TaxID=2698649 RepID=A0ABX2EWC4_9PSEU|nr:metabolite traffic protein EboE [Kibdelosporangium persicum]NRN63043.1 Xylose isomerase domain-containing protein TIM barrel [Kibdelosporangium persicum]